MKTQTTGKTILSTKTLPNEWNSLGRTKQDLKLAAQIRREDRAEVKAEKQVKAKRKAGLKKLQKVCKALFRNRARVSQKSA